MQSESDFPHLFSHLSTRCDRRGGWDSYTAILCINEPIPVIILQEV